jgi:hypothetical protein
MRSICVIEVGPYATPVFGLVGIQTLQKGWIWHQEWYRFSPVRRHLGADLKLVQCGPQLLIGSNIR